MRRDGTADRLLGSFGLFMRWSEFLIKTAHIHWIDRSRKKRQVHNDASQKKLYDALRCVYFTNVFLCFGKIPVWVILQSYLALLRFSRISIEVSRGYLPFVGRLVEGLIVLTIPTIAEYAANY